MVPADLSGNEKLFQRNDGQEPATIARDRSLPTKGETYTSSGTYGTMKVLLHDHIKEFLDQHLIVRGAEIFRDFCKEIVST